MREMSRIVILCIATFCFLVSSINSFAQENNSSEDIPEQSVTSLKKRYGYVGLGIGNVTHETQGVSDGFSDSSSSALMYGGFKKNNIGFEGTLFFPMSYSGEVNGNFQLDYDETIISTDFMGYIHAGEKVELFGRAGLGYVFLKSSIEDDDGREDEASGLVYSFSYGVGANFNISERFGIRVDLRFLNDLTGTTAEYYGGSDEVIFDNLTVNRRFLLVGGTFRF